MSKPSYRRAFSLDKLMSQLNTMFPDRDKESDGWIGDLAHSKRKSDHNPWLKDGKGTPVVTGQDIDKDISATVTTSDLLKVFLKNKDPRIKYIIFNGKIYQRKNGFIPENYTGPNAHKHHLHLSVAKEESLFDNTNAWLLDFQNIPLGVPAKEDEIYKKGSKGTKIEEIQQRLGKLGFFAHEVDGDFGTFTELAVKRFQKSKGLKDDGIVGSLTLKILFGE